MPNEINLLINADGLAALAELSLAPKSQTKLDDLLTRNSAGMLTPDEVIELDSLLNQIDALNIVKARAGLALLQMKAKE
jgi:short-subunit dehydrogenase involved in D-alanine esterification of teichoic acids